MAGECPCIDNALPNASKLKDCNNMVDDSYSEDTDSDSDID